MHVTKMMFYDWSLVIVYFLPRDARSAKLVIAIVSRPSVRPSLRLSVSNDPVRLSVGDFDVP